MEGVNELVFDRNQYSEEYEMWDDISNVIRILIKNNYVSVFKYDDCDYYWLRWVDADESLGSPIVTFLSEEENTILNEIRSDIEFSDN